ncbi:MAG: rod shape-determining protein MreC [Parcubacteria group bacterium]
MIRRKFFKNWIFALILVIVIIFLNHYVLGGFIQNTAYRITLIPKDIAQKDIPWISEYIEGFFRVSDVVTENRQLQELNKQLLGKISELEQLERENERLKEQLGVRIPAGKELLPVSILDFQRNGLTSTIIINAGHSDGVESGMPVIAHGNILSGVVEEVFNDTSRILLLDDSRNDMSVRIANSDILSKATGILGDKIKLDLITVEDIVAIDTLVVTSGLDGFPEALLVGSIESIELEEGALFKKVIATVAFDLTLGPQLFVLK